jgi:hypothetical protein
VVFNNQAVPDASLTAVDLATGKAIALKAWSDTPGQGATGTQRTDATGAFDLELPKLGDDQLVKLTATAGSQTYTALFDARGRAIGAASQQGASYRLAQGQAVSVTIRLKLTPATTAAAKAFEGALKLTFQLPKEAQQAERDRALAAAEQAAREVEAALAARPELADGLVVSVGADGEVRDLDAFRSTIAKLGVFDKVFEALKDRLLAVTAQKLTAEGELAPITAEDFPLDRVRISRGGSFTFTGGRGAVGGTENSTFVPTPGRSRRRGTADPGPRWVRFNAPAEVSWAASLGRPSGLLISSGVGLLHMSPTGVFTPIEELGLPRGRRGGLAASSGKVVFGLEGMGGLFTLEPSNGATATIVENGDFKAIGAGASNYYAAQTGEETPVRWFSIANPSVASGVVRVDNRDWTVSYAYAISAFEGGASPTVFVAELNKPIRVGVKDGGPARDLVELRGAVTALVIATPTLYVAAPFAQAVYAINVNEGTGTVFVAPEGSNLDAEVKVTPDENERFRPFGLALDETYLYVTSVYISRTMSPALQGRVTRVRLEP